MKQLALAVATASLVLTGCTLPGASSGSKDKPPSCGQCQSEVNDLKTQIEQIPGVNKVGQFAYNSDTNAGSGPGLRTDIDVTKRGPKAVADAVIKAAWESRITPLEKVVVVTTQNGGGLERCAATFYGNDLDKYKAQWGPRPVK